MQAVVKSALPFPKWQYNTNISVYKVTVGEDGETAQEVFTGPAIREAKNTSKYSDLGRILKVTGLYIIHGEINDGLPFFGYLVENGERHEIANVIFPQEYGKTYTTEVTTL